MLEFKDPVVNATDKYFNTVGHAGLAYLKTGDVTQRRTKVTFDGEVYLNFILNSCLGLETDPRIKKGIIDSTKKMGSGFYVPQPFFLAPEYYEFEQLLSRIVNAYPVISLSSTLAHLGAIPVLVQKNDLIIFDFFTHQSMRIAVASIQQKCASIKTIPHNNMGKLEAFLKEAHRDPKINNVWYFADGIYSIQGDETPLMAIEKLLNKYPKFYAYVDDAHGMSIIGEHGKGYTLGSFKTLPEKLVVSISLSKSFGMGCGGAVIVANQDWQKKIKTCGNTFIFTAPIPTPMYGAGIAAAKIHLSPEITTLQNRLKRNIIYFENLVKKYKLPLLEKKGSYSHIFFFILKKLDTAINLAKSLKEKGIIVGVYPYPAVSKNSNGIRIIITAKHTKADILLLATSMAGYLL